MQQQHSLLTNTIINSHLHILKFNKLLRICNHIWDGSPERKTSVAFTVNKLLHGLQNHPERWRLVDTQK